MLLGRVEGSIVATVKNPALAGVKLALIQPISPNGDPSGSALVAEDSVGTGKGQTVLVATGGAARSASRIDDGPIDAVVIAIVDEAAD